MTKKIFRSAILLLIACLMVVTALPVSAKTGSSYTYSIDHYQLESPDAYTPVQQIDSAYMGLTVPLNAPSDLLVAPNGDIYLADPNNNRIVCLDRYFKLKYEVSAFVNEHGLADSLANCKGCFVTEKTDMQDSLLYVADTGNSRIVVFNLDGTLNRIIAEPESDVFMEDAIYMPKALVVDKAGRIYVVSESTNEGVMALNADGEFQGFIGATKVAFNPLDILWRTFQTAEQRAKSESLVPTEFNNIAIDEDGFIYTTSETAGRDEAVKKLNSAGDNIMVNNGYAKFFGEVRYNESVLNSNIVGASTVRDVAMGPEKSWSIIDAKRSKVFTYDQYGVLLFAFGDTGMKLGDNLNLAAIAYQDNDMLLLDAQSNIITVYTRTEYGDILINALANENAQNYDAAVDDYKAILQRNANFDTAYIGIGKAMYRQYDWNAAMEYFKIAYDTANYSNAYKMWRKDAISGYILFIAAAIVVLVILLSKFLGYAGKVNARAAVSGKKKTFKEEVLYGFHLIFHPFDGFWDLKHEKRGSVRGSIFWLTLTVLSFIYQAVGQGYLFNPRASYSNILVQLTGFLVPFFLWIVANWCLTTLFEGEGSFKDIFIATSYCTVPLVLFLIPTTIATNFVTVTEASMVNLFVSIAWVWTGLLLFFGTMVTHDYSLLRNALTCLGTIVGMAFIMFLAILFSTLLMKVVGFISNICIELMYRF